MEQLSGRRGQWAVYSSSPMDLHRKQDAWRLFSQEKAALHKARNGKRIGELL
jgi:hypothetical protein